MKKSIADLNDGVDDAGELTYFNTAVSERASRKLFVYLCGH
jgi:hypothetical protein